MKKNLTYALKEFFSDGFGVGSNDITTDIFDIVVNNKTHKCRFVGYYLELLNVDVKYIVLDIIGVGEIPVVGCVSNNVAYIYPEPIFLQKHNAVKDIVAELNDIAFDYCDNNEINVVEITMSQKQKIVDRVVEVVTGNIKSSDLRAKTLSDHNGKYHTAYLDKALYIDFMWWMDEPDVMKTSKGLICNTSFMTKYVVYVGKYGDVTDLSIVKTGHNNPTICYRADNADDIYSLLSGN